MSLLAYPFRRSPGDVVNPPLGPDDGSALPPIVRVMLPTGQTSWLVSGHASPFRSCSASFPNLTLAGTLSDMDGRDDSIVYGLNRLDVTW